MSDNNTSMYDLFRNFWDWSFENPDLIKPEHCAVYAFAVEHCNRLGWKDKFGFPAQMAMEAIGIKSWRAYSKCFNDLVDWGFIILHQKSKNQYSANVIAIAKKAKASAKALDKALQKHSQKQCKYNNTTIQLYNYTNIPADEPPATQKKKSIPTLEEVKEYFISKNIRLDAEDFFNYYAARGWVSKGSQIKDWTRCVTTWKKNEAKFDTNQYETDCFTGSDEQELITFVNGLTDDAWDIHKSRITFDDVMNQFFSSQKHLYISYSTLTKCDRLMKYATDIFRAKSIILTPATYGKRK